MVDERLDQLRDLINSKQWDKASALYTQAKDEFPESSRLLLMGSYIFFSKLDLFRARLLVERALEVLTESDPPKILGQIRYHLGLVARTIGDSHVALEHLTLFLQELPVKYPELTMAEGNAYFQLALTKRQRNDFPGAEAAYQQAIACCRRDGLPYLLCQSLHNLAWLYCHMKQPSEARTCLEEADTLLTSAELRIHQTLGEAFLAALEGDHAQAVSLCESIFRQAERGEPITAEEQAQAAWVAGMVALEQGNLDHASALADSALTYATQAKQSRLMNDASNLRREVFMRRREGA